MVLAYNVYVSNINVKEDERYNRLVAGWDLTRIKLALGLRKYPNMMIYPAVDDRWWSLFNKYLSNTFLYIGQYNTLFQRIPLDSGIKFYIRYYTRALGDEMIQRYFYFKCNRFKMHLPA